MEGLGRLGSTFVRGDVVDGLRVGYLRAVFEADKDAALEALAKFLDGAAPMLN